MTPRRFLCHPALKVFLLNTFPHLAMPTLSDLHPSLANRAHLGAYIAHAREEHFPHGTDWKGILHLKRQQDDTLPPHQRYIRVILELDNATLPAHDEDDDQPPATDNKTRIIVCMAPDSSARLRKAQYLESDIGFKRIVGFDEFEIAGMDRDVNTSGDPPTPSLPFTGLMFPPGIVFCRVYLTHHTAAAHQRIFHEINQIVLHDTGQPLYWQHIHGRSPNDFRVGLILHWGTDQHRGQAKGLGLHLADRAAELPLNTMDVHEPNHPLRALTPYDHLRRVYRVCRVHNYRNIQQCAVPAHVRWLMCSLACIWHPDWQGTINQILRDGGKAALDWVRDKENCKFAFSGICWERSFIPLPEFEQHGIRPSYHAVNPVTNAIKNVIRRDNGQAKKVQTTALAVSGRFDSLKALVNAPHLQKSAAKAEVQRQLHAASNAARTTSVKYTKQVEVGQALWAAGCHGVSLPSS
ncbi:hypothetical protein B0H13DRAFT_2335594 [Mycena leptocephala]|nr:hypothetical protein B0H13DRAFT_2335594 [Mycena leptocephala]